MPAEYGQMCGEVAAGRRIRCEKRSCSMIRSTYTQTIAHSLSFHLTRTHKHTHTYIHTHMHKHTHLLTHFHTRANTHTQAHAQHTVCVVLFY